MYRKDPVGMHWNDKVEIECDDCHLRREVLVISAKRLAKKNDGLHFCGSCSAKRASKPQNSADYWDCERKKQHGRRMKESEAYKVAIAARDQSGPLNGMFGRKHSDETRQKMSLARTGKLGINATAWKGGKTSFTKRVKGLLHTRYDWYGRVFKRDGWKCRVCESKRKIEAHHILPVVTLIRTLTKDRTFSSEEEKLEWVINQEVLKDEGLNNGITLCRDCHRQAHSCWGSKISP